MPKNTICLWYDHDAEEAARFYAKTFPQSSVGAVHRAPADYPDGKAGDALTVEFTVIGIIASNARLAAAPPLARASVNTRGVICQLTPHLSLHQPHWLSCPPLPTIAFQ